MVHYTIRIHGVKRVYLLAHVLERNIGIKYYVTKTPGIDGKTRLNIDDFIVEEDVDLRLVDKGYYCIFCLEKASIGTLEAIRKIAIKLNVPVREIRYAGLKDANARARQYISIPAKMLPKREQIETIEICRGVKLRFLGYSHTPITLSLLKGNLFNIRIHNIDIKEANKRIEKIKQEIMDNGGLPSFFGHQRFGTRRPNTHIIGKYIVLRLWKQVVWEIIGHPYPFEHDRVREARKLADQGEYKEALRLLPQRFWYERKVLKLLLKGYPPLYIIRRLPSNLLEFFIQAYQSYLFNLILSSRLEEGLKPRESIEGDIILNVKTGQLRYELRNRFLNENEVIILPIPGCKVKILPKGRSLRIIQEVLSREEVNYDSFKIKELGISLQGSLRQTPFIVYNFSYTINEGYHYVNLNFYLNKGMYATIVLREFMKCNPLHFT